MDVAVAVAVRGRLRAHRGLALPIAILAAPTNFGLRPPQPTAVPGCSKAPEAYRAAGLYRTLMAAGAVDAGLVPAGRYLDDFVPGQNQLRNHHALLEYSSRLAAELGRLIDAGSTPVILGGDCSILLGVGEALHARGRFGLVHIDGHTDFRHPGNSPHCSSLAGEDLAAAVGRHWDSVARHGGGPHFSQDDVVQLGCREDDEHLREARQVLAAVRTADEISASPASCAELTKNVVQRPELDGFWLHLDVDVLDPQVLPAVDSPAAGGLSISELTDLMQQLAPAALGIHVTVFDPDLDPDGRQAALLSQCLADGLADLGSTLR
jgi:arginase